jgi:Tol biopolymer transport system component
MMVLGSSAPPLLQVERVTALTADPEPKSTRLVLATDRVYYLEEFTHTYRSVPIGGGPTTPLFGSLSEFWIADVNFRRSEFLALRQWHPGEDAELWALPMQAGKPRRIGNIFCSAAAFSPDAERIVVVTGQTLKIAAPDGRILMTLSGPSRGNPEQPHWSPDGGVIRFTVVSESAGARESAIWEERSDGQHLRRVLEGWQTPANECCGIWTPDGNYFIFQVFRDGINELWAVAERTGFFSRTPSAPILLYAGPLNLWPPVVSRNAGTGLDAHTVLAIGAPSWGQLVRLDVATHKFLPYLLAVSGTWITFSPDRQSIAYVGFPDHKLWRSRADGHEKKQLTFDPSELDGTAWSPTGKWIAFLSRMHGEHFKINVIPADGGDAAAIDSDDRKDQGVPSWSPDGTHLAFGEAPDRLGHPTGTAALQIFDVTQHTVSDVPGSQGLWSVRWCPDPRYLAALTIDTEQRLTIFDFQTDRWHALPADHVDNPNWSHDGKYIYYDTYDTEGRVRSLRRVRVADGRVEPLADLPVASYRWSGLAPDDSPIVLMNLGTTEVYALELGHR